MKLVQSNVVNLDDFALHSDDVSLVRRKKLGASVRVNVPRFLPKALSWLAVRNAGKEGCVVCVEKGKYSGETFFGVIFEDGVTKPTSEMYLEKELTFLSTGINDA